VRIAALHAAGKSNTQIAAEVGRTERHVRRVLQQLGESGQAVTLDLAEAEPEPVVIDPFAEVARTLAEQRQVARAARRLASESKQDAVRVSALKLLAGLARDRIDVLDRFAALPTGPSWLLELHRRGGVRGVGRGR